MKKLLALVSLCCLCVTFVNTQELEKGVRDAVNKFTEYLPTRLDVSIGSLTLEGTDASTPFSQQLNTLILNSATNNPLSFNVVGLSQSRGGPRRPGDSDKGIIKGTFAQRGNRVEVSLYLVSDSDVERHLVPSSLFSFPLAELPDNALVPENENKVYENSAHQKFALVIGNGAYTGVPQLKNPVNDANDMETTLRGLGFTDVKKVLNGNLDQMETAIQDFRRRLSGSRNSYGFFFFAGHGVQVNGANYLIPVDANNIQSENHLRQRAVSVQTILDNLNDAGNELNIVVLDACRDNPFNWARNVSRGLAPVNAPIGSIVVYATSANSTADDGTGKNGLFTSHLLNNLRTQGLSVFEVFDKTMGDVIRVTNGKQHPEISLKFPGAASAYLGAYSSTSTQPLPEPTPSIIATKPTPPVQTEPSPSVVQPDEDEHGYSGAIKKPNSRLGIALGNIFFGLGSYISGDWAGGLTVTGGYLAAGGLILWELYGLKYEDSLAGIIGPIGVGIGGLALIYGIARPYIHSRNSRFAYLSDNFNIAIVSTKENIMAVHLSYKIEF